MRQKKSGGPGADDGDLRVHFLSRLSAAALGAAHGCFSRANPRGR
jgi:hypothetical protein